MKFLFVVPTLSGGGAERVATILSNKLADEGHIVSLLYYHSTDNEYFVSENVNSINLSNVYNVEYKKLSYIGKIKRIRNIIKKENADFIIPFLSHACAHVFFASVGLDCKVIYTVRNNPNSSPKNFLRKKLRDYIINHSYKTIVQNNEQKMYFKEKIHDKIYVLPNPISDDFLDVQRNKNHDKFVIASAGRLTPQKNFKMLIDSVENICKENSNIVLQIYGEGELKEELQNYIDEKQLNESVFLMGRTNDMKNMLSNIDLYILSSDFEGMPNSLMEAMAVGIPCISTDCPTGPSDMIENGKNGFLVPVNDSVSMEIAIKKMLTIDMVKIGENAKKFIRKNYSSIIIINKLIDICNS